MDRGIFQNFPGVLTLLHARWPPRHRPFIANRRKKEFSFVVVTVTGHKPTNEKDSSRGSRRAPPPWEAERTKNTEQRRWNPAGGADEPNGSTGKDPRASPVEKGSPNEERCASTYRATERSLFLRTPQGAPGETVQRYSTEINQHSGETGRPIDFHVALFPSLTGGFGLPPSL